MKKLGSIFIIFTIILFSGCARTTICPTYPKPSKEILQKIKSLNDDSVDLWMIEQFKLNKKLGVCNGL